MNMANFDAYRAAHQANMAQLQLAQRFGQVDPRAATLTAPRTAPAADPTALLASQYGYAQLLHGQGARKNASRESTQHLKNWLNDHSKNPYPTKAEKVYLAILSGVYFSTFYLFQNLSSISNITF